MELIEDDDSPLLPVSLARGLRNWPSSPHRPIRAAGSTRLNAPHGDQTLSPR